MEADDLAGLRGCRGCLLAGQVQGDRVCCKRAANRDTALTEDGLMRIEDHKIFKNGEGLPWWSSGSDLAFLMQGAWVPSLIGELDPVCHNQEFACCN